jgi:hypothetical protein
VSSKQTAKQEPNAQSDEWVPDPQVLREFNISSMTLHRWDNDPTLGFPPKYTIRRHNFRSRKALEEFKRRVIETALKTQRRRLQQEASG